DLPNVPSVAEIPVNFRPSPIGKTDALFQKVLSIVPFAEQQDEEWLFVRTAEIDLSIELVPEAGTDRLSHITVYVHEGEKAALCVAAIVRGLGLRALDTSAGAFFDTEAPGRSAAEWNAYRERIAKQG
ncbi:MAG TPA: hypothetical protein VHL57_02910, partial [Flavobacteriales bacterium]|nr:hypothetical protein [Flavobacteriales bacterium]